RHIFMLRKALGESPQDHRCILTIPGAGYRLAENVQVVSEPEITLEAASTAKVQVEVRETSHWRWALAAVPFVLALIAIGVYYRTRPAKLLGTQDTVLLGDFANSTGDSVFDATLRQGLAVQLEQSPFLSLVSDGRIQQTLQRMNRPADTRLSGEVARDVCQRTGATAILEGSIAPIGSQYVLSLRATRCSNGDGLDQEQAQAAHKEDVLITLSAMAAQFRRRVGESLTQIQEHEKALPDATTSSLEALKAYATGLRLVSTSPAATVPFFRRAIELDPNFAMAYGWLARQYGDLNEFALSREMAAKAYELRNRTSDPEQFWIAADYNTQVKENLETAREVCEVWAKTYPREPPPLDMMAGIIDPTLGRYDSALDEAKQALARDPGFGVSYHILAARYRNTGQITQAVETLNLAQDRGAIRPELLLERYDLAFLQHDAHAMQQSVSAAANDPVTAEWVAEHEADVSAWQGRLRDARARFAEAERLADAGGRHESAALYLTAEAVTDALFGDSSEAKAAAGKALAISRHDAGVEYGAALALALAGDIARAQALTTDLERTHAEDTSVRISYLPVLKAMLALQRRNPQQALDALAAATPYDLGSPRTAIHANFGALYPPYARGLALLAAGQSAQAGAEFRKLIQHPGIVVNDPIGVLAQLQLARALRAAGDTAESRAAYEQVLATWKDADPDAATVRQARAEYRTLTQVESRRIE
ncbi:MAG TPA: hypothetical protein VJV22_10645, partial [Acidobacteriaceae bacterium]|nr:hypothetical protein [Acidobacteriaceae bacterium]